MGKTMKNAINGGMSEVNADAKHIAHYAILFSLKILPTPIFFKQREPNFSLFRLPLDIFPSGAIVKTLRSLPQPTCFQD